MVLVPAITRAAVDYAPRNEILFAGVYRNLLAIDDEGGAAI
jgi:hypothetical protein